LVWVASSSCTNLVNDCVHYEVVHHVEDLEMFCFPICKKIVSLKHSYTIIKMDVAKNDDNQRHFSWFYKVGNLWKINGIRCICAKIVTI